MKLSTVGRGALGTLVVAVITLLSPAPAQASIGTLDGVVYNLSDSKMGLAYNHAPMGWTDAPHQSIIYPGFGDSWSAAFPMPSMVPAVNLNYTVRGEAGTDQVTMYIELRAARCWFSGRDSGKYACATRQLPDGTVSFTLTNSARFTRVLTDADRQQQAAVVNGLCLPNNLSTCTFQPRGELTRIVTDRHPVGSKVFNCGDTTADQQVSWSDTQGQSDSVGVSASAKVTLAKIVELSITASYDHTWTTSHTFSQSDTVHVSSGSVAWIDFGSPALRATGDLVVKLGNLTWQLSGVSFDAPDPDGRGVVVINSRPMTEMERAMVCAGQHLVVVR